MESVPLSQNGKAGAVVCAGFNWFSGERYFETKQLPPAAL
jgi:hypothetical protein